MVHVNRDSSPVLAYHACFHHPPKSLGSHVHNVHPSAMRQHLLDLQKHFTIVPLDEFAEARDKRGLAAITFDDAYRILIQHAFPLFIDLGIPFTVFINGCTLEQKFFWRDKIRYLINHGLVEPWEQFTKGRFKIKNLNFYHYTKHPSNNSRQVDESLSEFLQSLPQEARLEHHCFYNDDFFIRHPLVTYGNHSHHHYVLPSLEPEQQAEEIQLTQERLKQIQGIQISRLFAFPFGRDCDFNDTSVGLLKSLGYTGYVLNRGRLNPSAGSRPSLSVVERFTASTSPILHQIAILERRPNSGHVSTLRKKTFDPEKLVVCIFARGERTVSLAQYCLAQLGLHRMCLLDAPHVEDKWQALTDLVTANPDCETIVRIDGDILVFDGFLDVLERLAKSPYLHWCKTIYFDSFKKPGEKFANGCPDVMSRDVLLAFHRSPWRKKLKTMQKPSTAVMDRGAYGGLGRVLSIFSSLHDFEQWPSKVCQTFINKQMRGEYPSDYVENFPDRVAPRYRRAILESQQIFAQNHHKIGMNYLPLDLSHLDDGVPPIADADLPRLYDKYARFYRKKQRAFQVLKR